MPMNPQCDFFCFISLSKSEPRSNINITEFGLVKYNLVHSPILYIHCIYSVYIYYISVVSLSVYRTISPNLSYMYVLMIYKYLLNVYRNLPKSLGQVDFPVWLVYSVHLLLTHGQRVETFGGNSGYILCA